MQRQTPASSTNPGARSRARTEDDEISGKMLAALPANARRAQIAPVLASAVVALRGLARLDEQLFGRRTASGALVVDVLARAADDEAGKRRRFLQGVAATLWRGAGNFIRVVEKEVGCQLPTVELDIDALDFGFEDPAPPLRAQRSVDAAAETDISLALDVLDSRGRDVSAVDVARAALPLTGALQRELNGANKRLLHAIDHGAFGLAIQVLDRTRESLEGAVIAVVEAIFELHRVEFSRVEYIPGYRTALDEALELRQAFAELRRAVAEDNEALASGEGDHDEVRTRITAFIESRAFSLMRAADRLQMLELRDRLKTEERDSKEVEGLSKYLDSLGAINERAILVQHDRACKHEVIGHLESADALAPVSARAAAEQAMLAFRAARRMKGLRDEFDNQLERWHPGLTGDALSAWSEALRRLL